MFHIMLFQLFKRLFLILRVFFFFKQKTAYEMRISDWSSDVCSSDLPRSGRRKPAGPGGGGRKNASQGVDVLRNRANMCGSPDGKASGPEHRGNAGIDTERC